MIDKHRSLIKDRDDLASSSQDASRLMLRGQKGEKRDPTRLLREEKMRKRIAKELPKVEAQLKKTLEAWEDEYGRPFLVHGERYLDDIAAAQAKTAPPRSKTPSGPVIATTTTTKVPLKADTVGRAGTRGAPPSRSKTPTSFGTGPRGTGGRTPNFSASTAPDTTRSNKSPSRIPARAPLSNLQYGNNSPERKHAPTSGKLDNGLNQVVRMGPPRLPPPKMKDLFAQSMMATPSNRDNSMEHLERSNSIVRSIPPDDVYDDRSGANSQMSQRSNMSRSMQPSHHNNYPSSHYTSLSSDPRNNANRHFPNHQSHSSQSQYSYPMAPPSRPESRQISATSQTSLTSSSSVPSQISGSENWETYDDASEAEPETDATEAYYAKVRAAQAMGKRATPEDGWAPTSANQNGGMGKKIRGLLPGQGVNQLGRVESGSEAGWTDEDGF
jgi:protein regulator of cytokinesis 1